MNLLGLTITRTAPGPRRRGLGPLVVLTAVAGTSVLGTGVAYAYWSATGTGSGSASATTFQAVTVTTGSAPAGQLYPGLTADGSTQGGDLVVTASNPNPFPVVVAVALTGASGCTTPAVALLGTPSFTLPAGAANASRTLSKVVSMGVAASNDCQGATLTLALSTTATSS